MRLMEYLPEKYERSPETAAIQEAIQPEADALWAARDWLLEQLNPRTASGEGLKLWEDAMGVRPAAEDSLDERRGRVIARIRGMGVVNAPLLKAVVESFLVSAVEVIERPRDNFVDIQYSTAGMVPQPSMAKIAAVVLDILPAHIGLGLRVGSTPMHASLYCGGAAASRSRSTLPEWRMNQSITKTVNIAGVSAARSRTGLPPVEYFMEPDTMTVGAAPGLCGCHMGMTVAVDMGELGY